MSPRVALVVAALGAGLVVLVTGSGHATPTTGAASPHGRPDTCVACHATIDGSGPPRPEAETCLGCHPEGDPHPSGVTPRGVTVPAGWPLIAGQVTCATCHAEPSCEPTRGDDAPYLRGGNVARVGDFCARCHTDGALARTNPHHPMGNGAADTSCAACHQGIPTSGARPEDALLRTTPEAACRTCHPGAVHAGVEPHLGATPHGAGSAALPLTADNRIACWTCHDVHGGPTPSGGRTVHRRPAADAIRALALPAGSPAEATAGADPHALLALESGQLCSACHGEGP